MRKITGDDIFLGISVVVILGIIAVYALICRKTVELEQQRDYWKAEAQKVPTIFEVQERIGAEPDGIIGPETIEKWNRAIIDSNERR